MTPVRLYFDFVSPYACLALLRAEAFAEEHGVEWELRPVAYGAVLRAQGLIGPAEHDVKRHYTVRDVVRSAAALGLTLRFPPVHPFRSLEALRTSWAFRDDARAMSLAVGLARACWVDGRPLTDRAVIADVLDQVGLPHSDLPQLLSSEAVKDGVRQATQELMERGGFGVPTFELDGELFWGQDRMQHLALRLAGSLPPVDGLPDELVGSDGGDDR